MAASFVTIPNTRVQLTIDQLVAAVRQMDPGERAKIARALTDVELDQELAQLISELYSQPPVTEISDADIVAEVRTVRQQVHFLATAIDGRAGAIVTGDDDLRADDELRSAMAHYGVQLWGVQSLFDALADRPL